MNGRERNSVRIVSIARAYCTPVAVSTVISRSTEVRELIGPVPTVAPEVSVPREELRDRISTAMKLSIGENNGAMLRASW